MNEKLSMNNYFSIIKKSFGVMIGIPRNGCKTSRSLSPVIMQSAFPDKASSRYLLSFGSRHSFILWVISIKDALLINLLISINLSFLVMYLFSLDLFRVLFSSFKVSSDNRNYSI